MVSLRKFVLALAVLALFTGLAMSATNTSKVNTGPLAIAAGTGNHGMLLVLRIQGIDSAGNVHSDTIAFRIPDAQRPINNATFNGHMPSNNASVMFAAMMDDDPVDCTCTDNPDTANPFANSMVADMAANTGTVTPNGYALYGRAITDHNLTPAAARIANPATTAANVNTWVNNALTATAIASAGTVNNNNLTNITATTTGATNGGVANAAELVTVGNAFNSGVNTFASIATVSPPEVRARNGVINNSNNAGFQPPGATFALTS